MLDGEATSGWLSPQPFDPVGIKRSVVTDNHHFLGEALSNHEPIERIAMVQRESRDEFKVLKSDRLNRNIVHRRLFD